LSAANIPDPIASPTVTTVYTVMAVANGLATYTSTITINVVSIPFSVTAIPATQATCSGNIGIGFSANYTYAWTPANTNTLTPNIFSAPSPGLYTALVTNSTTGCSQSVTTAEYFPWYYIMKNGPDGKLYIGNEAGQREYMSYIEFPNVRGKGCNFCPQCLWQPFTNIKSPPNMPNYGLGPELHSPCDTIRQAPQAMVLYPNPTKGVVKIKIPTTLQRWQQYATINIYNMQGQRILQTRPILNTDYEMEINVGEIASGLYTVELHSDALLGGGARKLWKVVVE
jgi:hypothetical protein